MFLLNFIKICLFDRRYPELFKWFKDFLGYKESGMTEAVSQGTTGKERITGDLALEIGMMGIVCPVLVLRLVASSSII